MSLAGLPGHLSVHLACVVTATRVQIAFTDRGHLTVGTKVNVKQCRLACSTNHVVAQGGAGLIAKLLGQRRATKGLLHIACRHTHSN